jgi:hypothetical protein
MLLACRWTCRVSLLPVCCGRQNLHALTGAVKFRRTPGLYETGLRSVELAANLKLPRIQCYFKTLNRCGYEEIRQTSEAPILPCKKYGLWRENYLVRSAPGTTGIFGTLSTPIVGAGTSPGLGSRMMVLYGFHSVAMLQGAKSRSAEAYTQL